MTDRMPIALARIATATLVLMATACATSAQPDRDRVAAAVEATNMSESESASVVVEGDGVRLEAVFGRADDSDALHVRYRLQNTGGADIAVFDRGNSHAVLTKRQQAGAVGDPYVRDEGGGELTLSHVALPLPQPAPTVPLVPLAVKLPAGDALEGAFVFPPPMGGPVRRLRWCLGTAPFDSGNFSMPERAGGVEIWQAAFALADSQQLLCTPWFDPAAGTFLP